MPWLNYINTKAVYFLRSRSEKETWRTTPLLVTLPDKCKKTFQEHSRIQALAPSKHWTSSCEDVCPQYSFNPEILKDRTGMLDDNHWKPRKWLEYGGNSGPSRPFHLFPSFSDPQSLSKDLQEAEGAAALAVAVAVALARLAVLSVPARKVSGKKWEECAASKNSNSLPLSFHSRSILSQFRSAWTCLILLQTCLNLRNYLEWPEGIVCWYPKPPGWSGSALSSP